MSLGNIKSEIIAFVNEALNTSYATTALDTVIKLCLNDLSNAGLLPTTDTSQILDDGDFTLNYPTDFKPGFVSIVLVNASLVSQKPLLELPGGHKEYRQLRDSDSASGLVEWFSEFDEKFWLWRPPGQPYTTIIEYFRNHPQTPGDILFSDEFRNAIFFGTTYFKAMLARRIKDRDFWSPIYYAEKEARRIAAPEQPFISRG